jgi:tetrahydromethanopterin S-methyltransferase subunit D
MHRHCGGEGARPDDSRASIATAEVIAMSVYSDVHAMGNTRFGGTYDGLRNREYQRVMRGLLATLPVAAVAATASVVAARVFLLT